jgi:hypothetical protein
MRQAAIHSREVKVDPFVKGLGIRINKLIIINEKDSVKIRAKEWLDLKA